MNQKKIGHFLSELRKEQEMTQQQLADAIGVSNKTISKWECGNGMPELSSIMPLCQTLHINVNELLSGERLPENDYSMKAEENMMNLIQETELTKKKHGNSLSIIIVTIIAVLLSVGLAIISNFGISMNHLYFDMPTLLPMLIITILFLLGTHLGRPFLQAFSIVTEKMKIFSELDLMQAKSAIKLVGNTWLGMGILLSCMGFMAMMPSFGIDASLFLSCLHVSIPIALLGILYGLIGFLFLLPIRMKLETLFPEGTIIPNDK
uniref:helix-turn-helix domain-containing protein n=1 Tax=Acetatifactor sp. TaxID=1872090 RepID=UPI0040570BCF